MKQNETYTKVFNTGVDIRQGCSCPLSCQHASHTYTLKRDWTKVWMHASTGGQRNHMNRCGCHVPSSVAVIAKILLRSPRELFISNIKKCIYRIKVSKKKKIIQKKISLVPKGRSYWGMSVSTRSQVPGSSQNFTFRWFWISSLNEGWRMLTIEALELSKHP